MNYFFHSSIKNYTIALLDLFGDLHVPRFSSTGEILNDITIPIKFGSRDKAYLLNEHDNENLINGNINTLPRMVLSFDSLTKALDRNTNKLQKINKRTLDNNEAVLREYQYNAVAYDFNFTIYIATRTFTDATIIIEQIAPMFRPDISLKIQELDIQEVSTTVPVTLGDFSVTLPEDMDVEDIRIIQVEVPIVLKGNLYLPIKDAKIIREVEVLVKNIETIRNAKGQEYELDYTDAIISAKASPEQTIADIDAIKTTVTNVLGS